MPTYQYACTECGHGFEAVQAFTDDALTVCPQCGGRLRKVFSSVGIVFKGSGFYRNDSREKAPSGAAAEKPAGDKQQKAEPASDGKPAEKSDTPAAKPAAKAPADSTSRTSKPGRSSTEGSAA